MEQEKIFANNVTDKGLISKLYKQLIQQTTKPNQTKTPKQSNQKWDNKPEQAFLQRRHPDGQQSHDKMLIITNYQKNEHQNYNEVSLQTSQNGHQQSLQITNAGECFNKKELYYAVGRNVNWCMCVLSHAQQCLTLRSYCSPPGSSVHGILQARILEWVAIFSSRGSSQQRDRTCIS